MGVEKLLRYLNSHAGDYIQFKLTQKSLSINLFNLATLIRLWVPEGMICLENLETAIRVVGGSKNVSFNQII